MADDAQETLTHPVRVDEADQAGDLLEGLAAALDHGAGRLDPQALDRLGRRHAGGSRKDAAELAHAQAGDLGEALHRQILGQVLAREAEGTADPVRAGIELEQRGELVLAARPTVVDDQHAGDRPRDLRSQILLDHRERHVDAGGHAGRGPHRAVMGEDAVAVDLQRGVAAQPLMFHHGWPLSSDDRDAQLLYFLGRGYRVVAHDRRGHGRSIQVGDGHDMDHYAADAAASQGVIQNWWRQGMSGGAKAHYDGIEAFSETDFTDDLKTIKVPTLVMHGDDDQIVPIAASALTLLERGTLKVYERFPHGMCTTHAETVNPDVLGFVKG